MINYSIGGTVFSYDPEKPPGPKNLYPFQVAAAKTINRGDMDRNGNLVPELHELTIDIAGDATYKEGDVLAKVGQNDPEKVSAILSLLNGSVEDLIELPKVGEMTVGDALSHYLDFDKAVKAPLVQLVRDKAEAVDATEMVRDLDDALTNKDFSQLGNPIHLLSMAKTTGIQLTTAEFISTNLKSNAVRLFTIASSPEVSPSSLDLIVVSNSQQIEVYGAATLVHGLASHAAGKLTEDDIVRAYLSPKKGYDTPRDPEAPMFLVGAGSGFSGISTFLSGIEARKDNGEITLVTGAQTAGSLPHKERIRRWTGEGGIIPADRSHVNITRQDNAQAHPELDGMPGVKDGRVDFSDPQLRRELVRAYNEGAIRVCGAPGVAESMCAVLAQEIGLGEQEPGKHTLAVEKAAKDAGKDVGFDLF